MPRPLSDDPRYLRVRERLSHTVLEMAASRPVETVGVSELTAAAGVSRAVFYRHASSPTALLVDVLATEIDADLLAVLDELSDPAADHRSVWRRAYLGLLRHAERRSDVYRVAGEHGSSMQSALVAHFERLIEPAVRRVTARIDDEDTGRPTELWTRIAVGQQASNMLSVMRAWVHTGLVDDAETVVDTYLSLAPPWQLARADDDGTIRLRRSRRPAPTRARSD